MTSSPVLMFTSFRNTGSRTFDQLLDEQDDALQIERFVVDGERFFSIMLPRAHTHSAVNLRCSLNASLKVEVHSRRRGLKASVWIGIQTSAVHPVAVLVATASQMPSHSAFSDSGRDPRR